MEDRVSRLEERVHELAKAKESLEKKCAEQDTLISLLFGELGLPIETATSAQSGQRPISLRYRLRSLEGRLAAIAGFDNDEDVVFDLNEAAPHGQVMVATQDYVATDDLHLSFSKGARLNVVDRCDDFYYRVDQHGVSGLVPVAFLSSSAADDGLNSHLLSPAKGWARESSRSDPSAGIAVQEPEPWYKLYFEGASHESYVGQTDGGVVLLAALREHLALDGSPGARWRAIVWTKEGSHHALVDGGKTSAAPIASLLAACSLVNVSHKSLTPVRNASVSHCFRFLESNSITTAFKFGVVYVKNGQTKEGEFLANDPEIASDFETFLDLLGSRVRLQGWRGFAGGLDVMNDETGTTSLFVTTKEREDVMFHVCTMLPHDSTGQEVQRKRHIGNDVCCVVFLESGALSFDCSSIVSQFLHVYVVVCPLGNNQYRVAVGRRSVVPPFGPHIKHSVWEGGPAFADFLISKLVNGQRATLKTPEFAQKSTRTYAALLKTTYDAFKNAKEGETVHALPSPRTPYLAGHAALLQPGAVERAQTFLSTSTGNSTNDGLFTKEDSTEGTHGQSHIEQKSTRAVSERAGSLDHDTVAAFATSPFGSSSDVDEAGEWTAAEGWADGEDSAWLKED